MPCRRTPRKRLLLIVFCLLPSAFCFLPSAFAQTATATLSGTVEDQNGAVIPNASVSVADPAKGIKRQATTNGQGYFTVPLLPPSTYTVTVENQGFAPVQIQNVVLNVGDQKALQIQLKAGDINATVQVTNEAPLINESPAVGTVVNRQFVENLPLNGRSFQSLITLSPGVVLTKTNNNEQGQFSVNGQRADANYFLVDGVSANIGVYAAGKLGQTGNGGLPGFSALGGTNNLVSLDALQEFKIQTSTYAPEFGRTPGAQISIITRSGTNQFHGSAFDYLRNDIFDANDWFANRSGLAKPRERQNDFGGVLGGPLYLPHFGEGGPSFKSGKNKTFFFFSYEGLRLRQPQVGITLVPSLASRQGAPAPVQPFLNAFPLPNGPNVANGLAQFNASYSNPSTLNATSVRIDNTVSSKLTIFARYNNSPSHNALRGGGQSLNTVTLSRLNTQTLTVGATWAISQASSNDFRVNYSRNRGRLSYLMDNFGGAVVPSNSLLFPVGSSQNAQMSFFVSGVTQGWFRNGPEGDDLQRQINLVDNLSIVGGSHQLKFGVDYRKLSPVANLRRIIQSVFTDMPHLLTGTTIFDGIQSTPSSINFLLTNLSIFGQDTWRVTPRLVLTYGLRWELNPPPSEASGNEPLAVSGVDNLATLALAPSGTPLWRTTYNNFAPRIGVAYQLSKKQGGETILRGGVGIFYDLGTSQVGSIAQVGTLPYGSVKLLFGVPLPLDPTLVGPAPVNLNPPLIFLVTYDPNTRLPKTYQWNFALEHSFGTKQTVSASYVAAIGRRLLRSETLRNPNPTFTTVLLMRNTATSDYQALQLQFQRRLSRGLQALASYSWSHSIDTASNDSSRSTLPSQTINPQMDRGPSDFDVRHTFNGAITYNFPNASVGTVGNAILRNWGMDSIFTARTATPVNIITGSSSLFGVPGGTRPNLTLGVPLYLVDSTVGGGRRINRAAFAPPPAGQQGTLGRNALRGFGVWQLDFALRRQFNLKERVNLQLRAEFFNVFNHPNFGDPIGDLSQGLFGQSTSMLGGSLGSGGGVNGGFNPLYQLGGPRSLQLALKLQF